LILRVKSIIIVVNLGQTSLSRPKKPTAGTPHPSCCVKTQFSWVWRQDLRLLGPASRLNFLGTCIKTQLSWVRFQYSRLMGPASGPNSNGSCVRTQFSWVRRQVPTLIGLRFLNIIICVINIVIFIIIKNINIKILLFVL
jgi:hypothetical protein